MEIYHIVDTAQLVALSPAGFKGEVFSVDFASSLFVDVAVLNPKTCRTDQ